MLGIPPGGDVQGLRADGVPPPVEAEHSLFIMSRVLVFHIKKLLVHFSGRWMCSSNHLFFPYPLSFSLILSFSAEKVATKLVWHIMVNVEFLEELHIPMDFIVIPFLQ